MQTVCIQSSVFAEVSAHSLQGGLTASAVDYRVSCNKTRQGRNHIKSNQAGVAAQESISAGIKLAGQTVDETTRDALDGIVKKIFENFKLYDENKKPPDSSTDKCNFLSYVSTVTKTWEKLRK